ncbi:ATP-binding protein [[Eubacterium] hominis]|uniref:HAMP domain-containing sensor histidine kinase n=1 Tax=[Eubacterium] hominis TaxID=2764325 RepID=UPI003A4DB5D3
MRRFNEFIKQLSLTQQLFALIFCFVTFFALFFFVYLNGNVDKVFRDMVFDTVKTSQEASAESREVINGKILYPEFNDVKTTMLIYSDDKQAFYYTSDIGASVDEWAQIQKNIMIMEKNKEASIMGFYPKASTSYDSYYYISKVDDDTYLVSRRVDKSVDKYKDALVNSVIYITVIVVGFFFIILMMWVITLIHPLNQIRNYIEKVKQGKDAELHMNRKDEIGELAEALISMREELRKQEKTKEDMIHNISHDLKTPIATIKSYGESIKDGIYPYDTLEKSVDVIIENADRLESKVHSLLFMNRVEYLISQDVEGISSDMKEIVEKVVQANKVIKPEIEFVTDLGEVWFDGLAEPWRVAVENIVENALRYAKTKIEIHLNEEDGLTIANDGPCMDEDRIKVLFKPYEKGQGGKFGLGLSIVAKVVAANHYEVCGENTAEGVIFRITKPIQQTKKGR